MGAISSLFGGKSSDQVPVNTFQAPNMPQVASDTTSNISTMGSTLTDLLRQYMPFMNTQTTANTAGANAGATAAQTTIPGATNVGYGSIDAASALQGGGNQLMGSISPLLQGGNTVMNTAFDPQSMLYQKLLQQNQDQTNVTNAMYGVSGTPYGAGVADMSNQNFNIDWQNQQLQRQIAGLQGFGSAVGAAGGALGSAGTAFGQATPTAQAGQNLVTGSAELPFATIAAGAGANTNAIQGGIGATTGTSQPTIQDLLAYLGWGTQTNQVYNQGQVAGTDATTKQQTAGFNMLGDLADVGASFIPFPA
jgi:hypothetical protein